MTTTNIMTLTTDPKIDHSLLTNRLVIYHWTANDHDHNKYLDYKND
jgi:hypothetical protein